MRAAMLTVRDGPVFVAQARGLAARTYVRRDERLFAARADFARDFAQEGRLPDGPKWTLCDAAGVIGVGGIEALGDGVWGAWAYLADLRPRQWLLAAELARAVLETVRRIHAPALIQAVAGDHPGAGRVLERVGFSPTAEPTIYCMRGR